MAAAVPTCEPKVLVAGDSWAWDRHLGDYPASAGWQLSYRLVGESDTTDIAWSTHVSASGDVFEVRTPAALGENLTPGPYELYGRVTDGTMATTVFAGRVNLQPNSSTAAASKSQVKTELDALNAAMAGGDASGGIIEFSVGGRSVKYGWEDARRRQAELEYLYALEKSPDARLVHAARFV